jgi:hypothetical protein
MAIKQSNSDAVAAFLARGGKVTTCPPGEANATPLRKLAEENADAGLGYTVAPAREETQVVSDGDGQYVTIRNPNDVAWREE